MHALHALALALALALPGCTRGPVEAIGGDITPTPASPPAWAAFTIDGPHVWAPDGSRRTLYEDDAHALVRYVVAHAPDDAGPADAFVTFLVDGVVVDTDGVRLAPGKSKAYERNLTGLRPGEPHRLEVRVGSTAAKTHVAVQTWPRPGEPLALGEVTGRVDQPPRPIDGDRVVFSVALARAAGGAEAVALRIGLLCRPDGEAPVLSAKADDVPLPEPGAAMTVDVDAPACGPGEVQYGLELTLAEPDATTTGRILLVERPA